MSRRITLVRLCVTAALLLLAFPGPSCASETVQPARIKILVLDFSGIGTEGDRIPADRNSDITDGDDDTESSEQEDAQDESTDEFAGSGRQTDVPDGSIKVAGQGQQKQGSPLSRDVQMKREGTDRAADIVADELSRYGDFFDIVNNRKLSGAVRNNAGELTGSPGIEQVFKVGEKLGAAYILCGTIEDTVPEKITSDTYGGPITSVISKMRVSIALIDVSRRIQVFSKVIVSEDRQVYTRYSSEHSRDIRWVLVEKALKEASAAILGHFTARLSVEVNSLEVTDAAAAALYVDDMKIAPGEERAFFKGLHKIRVELDQHESYTTDIELYQDLKKVISLKSLFAYIAFRFTGATDFDPEMAMITLQGKPGTERISGAPPYRVAKGSYELKIAADGFAPVVKSIDITGGNAEDPSIIPVTIKRKAE